MKTRFPSALATALVGSAMTLLVGCETDGGKPVTSAPPPAPVIVTPSAPPPPAVAPAAPVVVTAPTPLATTAPAAVTPTSAAATPPLTVVQPPALSPAVAEIVHLAQANLGEEVLLAYVENKPAEYRLNVDQILYLHDIGVSTQVIAAMVRQNQAHAVVTTPSANTVTTTTVVTAPPAQPAAVPAEPPPQEMTYNYFHNTLSPYGSWIEVENYGWCWQPTVASINPNWRPYSDQGRWVWTDAGWYWQSDYSWGWIPFHYGRWHLSPMRGWVWVPDTVWGPAWVTWRYTDTYYGWAPLPPNCYYRAGYGFTYYGSSVSVGFGFGLGYNCYTFAPVNRVCDRTLWAYAAPPAQCQSIYNGSTVINNYINGDNNNVVINVGPGTAPVVAATRTEIRKVSLRDADAKSGVTIKPDALGSDGRTLAVYRPRLPDQAAKPPAEILRRQQETRKSSEALVRSEPVRRAVESRSTINARPIDSRNRATSVPVSPSSVNRRPAESSTTLTPRREPTRTPVPATPSAPDPEPAPNVVRPAPRAPEPRSPARFERVTPAQPQPSPRQEVRPERSPSQSVQPRPAQPSAPSTRSPEPRSAPPAVAPSAPRPEPRRSEPAPRSAPAPSITPRSEPPRSAPPASAAPRPSSPSPSAPSSRPSSPPASPSRPSPR